MLKRKFESVIAHYLTKETDKILLVNGARQIGKSYLIRYVGKKLFKHYVEINLREDKDDLAIFANVHKTTDLYMQISAIANEVLGDKSDTLIFLDEIQVYPHLMTMLKFLRQEGKYQFIASGSQLGVALAETPSIPIGSIAVRTMYQLDFEEFLWANGVGTEAIEGMRGCYSRKEALPEGMHRFIMQQFQYYLLIGGLPDAVNHYIDTRNIRAVRDVHTDIYELYKLDASQYDEERKLKIRRIYDMIPSQLENKKKRIVYQRIEDKKGKHFADYEDEFEYLIESGIALEVKAVSNPRFPLDDSASKNLMKLYLNDVGLLTHVLYDTNINVVLRDEKSINLGSVYENVVAQELRAHGFKLYYYDNKKKGEVDYLVNDASRATVLPIEVKSGKDYTEHSALDKFLETKEYKIDEAVVLSNEGRVYAEKGIWYMPVYYVMFMERSDVDEAELPELRMPEEQERWVKILEPFGTIYITSERPLEPQFEQYRIKINPLDMHHVMAFASLYIGDSQTMAAEAGVLGVPFVRFNDFVGRIGYLRELEDKYELGYGIKASAEGSVDALCSRVENLVAMKASERTSLFQERRQSMLSDKIDCAKFLTWFTENYPNSATEVKTATPEWWSRFK